VRSFRGIWRVGLAGIAAGVLALAGCGSAAGSTSATAARPTTAGAASDSGATLTFSVLPYGSPVTPAKIAATVVALEHRLKATGISESVTASGGEIVVHAKGTTTGGPPVDSSPWIYFYAWEPNLVAPMHRSTGTSGPGSAQLGMSEYDAVMLAAKRPAQLRASDTTWQKGCTPRQAGDCLYGEWFLLDPARRKMVCPHGASHCAPVSTRKALTDQIKPASLARLKAVRVEPGTVVVQSRPREAPNGHLINRSPDSYYVLNDDPALTGAALANPQQGFDEGPERLPNVTFAFTAEGGPPFERLTKGVARRGQEAQLPGISKEASLQHFAVTLDGQLLTVPSIDWSKYPEGIDPSNGSEISGGLTVARAKALAEEIEAGSLPLRIVLRETDLETTFP
jgi:SecD/SecF fusion protein